VAELAFVAGLGKECREPNLASFGKWRTSNLAGIQVSPNVLLFPDCLNYAFGYEHSLEAAWETLKPGFMNMAEGAMEIARLVSGRTDLPKGGAYMSRYHEVPQWKGTSPVTLSGTLKFNFSFGQAGIYSGEHEVVRPILALASKLIPYGGNYVYGPAPTKPTYLVAMIRALGGQGVEFMNTVTKAGEDIAKNPSGAGNAVMTALNELQSSIYAAIDRGIAAGAAGVRAMYLRQGRMTIGPFTCKSVAWDFNFEETDEYGFPYKGSITFSGLSSLYIATANAFVNSFDAGNPIPKGEGNARNREVGTEKLGEYKETDK